MRSFSSVQDLVESFTPFHEVEFDYHGMGYGLGWSDDGPYAYRRDEFGFYEQSFNNIDALLDEFTVGGKALRQIVQDLTNVTVY